MPAVGLDTWNRRPVKDRPDTSAPRRPLPRAEKPALHKGKTGAAATSDSPFFLSPRQSGTAICRARLNDLSLGMRNSLRKLVQTAWADRRPTAMDCAMLVLVALLTCLTVITAIGQWTATGYAP